MIDYEHFSNVDIRTGKITEVEDFPRAKNPSYKVRVDFGPEIGIKNSSVQATNYTKEELLKMQVVGVVNMPVRNIAGFMSEVLLLGVKDEDGQLSLLTPSHEGKIGSQAY